MANEVWQQEEQKFLLAIQDVKIPNAELGEVAFVIPKIITDLDEIPNGGGCYWIWTNEPVFHSLHKNASPQPFNQGEIIYNGIAKDDVRGRVKHHLFGHVDAGWSGISLDIHFGDTVSHRKKALSDNGKVPYIKSKKIVKRGNKKKGLNKGDEINEFKPIRSKDDFEKIYLSDYEKEQLADSKFDKIFFRNGIDLTEAKHSGFEFKVYYITELSSLYLEFIEKKWREDNGLPKLCSYSSGR
jgi:hypothetical protein